MSSSAATRPAAPGRHAALDRLRGVALVLMLIHHLTDWLTGDARAVLPGWRSFVLTDVAAVAFFVAAGASLGLFVASRRRRGTSRARVAGQVLRRYGLLVPIGLALDWAFWRSPSMFGVLEALGVAVVLAAAVAAVVPARHLPLAAVAALAAGVWSERVSVGHDAWLAREVIGGKFPLVTYLGFVLVGVAVARTGRLAGPRWTAGAAAIGVGASLVLLVGGAVPARYPGDVPFIVPGLAGTAIVYGLAQARWPGRLDLLDRIVRQAAAHTLGVFVAHYVVYGVLRQQGRLGEATGAVAVPLAVAVTVALCLLAPRVPQPPWSLRTGRRRPPAPAGGAAETGGTDTEVGGTDTGGAALGGTEVGGAEAGGAAPSGLRHATAGHGAGRSS
ncbi:MAG TPA: heparan-alpha-glucosaminide N-acetyltransferase domain-containing protein [Acidimicrobiales bacterium]|nr:heparan-alpha-glucosaminide N-acetyltransferase domain-containing protein [Acidimicrobiales bacterium]